MLIPAQLISIITFPGVIVHELAHQLFCRWCRIPVYEVKYFRIGNPCGYVVHEPVKSPLKNFLTAMGPFLINTLLGILITLPASVSLFMFRSLGGNNILNLVLGWLGISILMHAFPSTGDAKAMVQSILKNPEVNILAKILTAPFIGLIYIGAFGSIFWLDLIYAIAVAAFLPKLFSLFF